VGFVVDKEALGQVSSEFLGIPLPIILQIVPQSSSFIVIRGHLVVFVIVDLVPLLKLN
jgi:hypothetical protein